MKTFDEIASSNINAKYFDKESWYRDVIKEKYEYFGDEDFGIMIEYRNFFGYKIGHSRGAPLTIYDKIDENLARNILSRLKMHLANSNYLLLGIDFMEPPTNLTKLFERSNIRESMFGTITLTPRENWISKFNSKKRYDLLYAEKKGITFKVFDNYSAKSPDLIRSAYNLMKETYNRQASRFELILPEMFNRVFESQKYILAACFDENNEMICFSLILFSPDNSRAYRVFAGSSEKAHKTRATPYLELKLIDKLAEMKILEYDLWGISGKKDGVEIFKRSIGEKVIEFVPYYGVLRIHKYRAMFAEFVLNLRSELSFIYQSKIKRRK
jgi:hypothetical protein